MPSYNERKYTLTVNRVEEIIGADVPNDRLKVDLAAQRLETIATNLDEVGGQDQSSVDIAAEIANLADALKSNDNDELVARIAGEDGAEIAEEALNAGASATDAALVSYVSRALNSIDQDELISRVTDSSGTQLDPLTQDPLQTVSNDELRSRTFGPNSAGDLQQALVEAMNTAIASGDTGLVTYLSRALASQGEDDVRTDIQSAGIKVPTDQQDVLGKAEDNYGLAIDANTTVTLPIDGYSEAEVFYTNGDAATDLLVEQSWDDTNYFEVDTATGVTDYQQTFTEVTAQFVRLTITGTGASGDTADVVLGANP
jgi:hypothetical protein